jgi:amino acid adenylation domain-containing protein
MKLSVPVAAKQNNPAKQSNGDRLNQGSCETVLKAEFGDTENSHRVPASGLRGYWEIYLSDAPALDLPTDRPRPATLGSAIGVESRILTEELSESLHQLSREAGVEVATTGLAAYSVLLYRYTTQEKFVIAVERDGRMLPIVADFSERPRFVHLLRQLDAAVRDGSQAGPIAADLAELLGVETDTSRHAVFQVAFSCASSPQSSASPETLHSKTSGLDLYLQFSGSSLRLNYNEDLFDRGTAARMLGHIQQLLAGAIEGRNRRPAELPMLTDRERHELLVERNQTAREFSKRCLHEHVEAIAAKTPNEIAVVHAQGQLSYGELNARANQVAHSLRKLGVGRNVRVGICLQRSLDFAVAIVGVLKAGGSCVPLDPKYPHERLTLMLEDVAAPLVLTERGLLQANIPRGTQAVYISEEREKFAREPRSNPSAGSDGAFPKPSDIAYVIYTSGSTGRPRGVLLAHAGLANYTLGAAEQFELRPGDRMLQFCSISFDAALEEIFSTWVAGATLVLRDDEVSLEPSEFLEWVAKQRITAVDLPTAYWHEWVYALPELSERVPAGLRLVIVGGEKASPEAFASWHKFAGNRVRWINTYGPAEASVVATTYEPRLQPGDKPPAILPIGRPVANARVYLLDPDLNPVPVGVPGELHIGGAGVAQGYLNLPELTKEKFIADIFTNDAQTARMYKTGDLARYLPSGEIEFVGRCDNQVKIRGFRVEPGEIESVLAKHAGVQESAVVLKEDLREDRTSSKRLVGYVVRSGGRVNENELRRHVQKHLPEYMVPSEFVFLESMPLTPNGKVNRRALLKLKSDSPSENTQANATNDPLQAQLIAIWEELLGRKPIGIGDNFFELGGHSLLAARLMHRIKQVSGKTLPLAALLQAPTVEQLADVLRGDFSHHWSSLVAIQPEGSKPPFFMVHGVGGNVVGFVELGRRMKPDYPFYGLQSQGLDGKRPLFTGIEAMAAHYLAEIRTVQPNGPYHLGGFSLGGVVAYEMARQLRSLGEEVALLVLFDTYATNPEPVQWMDLLRHPGQVRFSQLPEEFRRKVRRTILARRLPEYLQNVMRTNARAAEQYRLQPYTGKAVLLRAGDSWLVKNDPYAAWSELIGELETIEIGGYHMDILREPQVSYLAERLKSCIDGAANDLGATEALASHVG